MKNIVIRLNEENSALANMLFAQMLDQMDNLLEISSTQIMFQTQGSFKNISATFRDAWTPLMVKTPAFVIDSDHGHVIAASHFGMN